MKHLKTFENFLSKIFSKKPRKGDGLYYWTEEEMSTLKSLGLKQNSPSSITTFYYKPIIEENIKEIQIEKLAEIDYSMRHVSRPSEDWFYNIYVTYNNNKETFQDFESFTKLIKYTKSLIKEIDVNINKYNL